MRNTVARIRLAATVTSLYLPVLMPLHWKKADPTTPRKPCDDERDPPQRLRYELHRPYSTWNVDASAGSLDRVQHDRILAGFGAAGGTRQVRWDLPRRHRRRLRCLPGRPGAVDHRRRADPGQRPDDGRAGDGGGDRTHRFRRHRQSDLRTALSVRPAHVRS